MTLLSFQFLQVSICVQLIDFLQGKLESKDTKVATNRWGGSGCW